MYRTHLLAALLQSHQNARPDQMARPHQNARRRDVALPRLTAWAIMTIWVVSIFASTVLWAHGTEKHVMGTVTAIAADSITVETTSHQVQTVQITSQTKFLKGDQPSSLSDLKVGDRVIIHAKPSGDKLEATEVKSGARTHAAAKKQP